MRSVEISAPTLEEARTAAAFQLGVSEDEIEVEILAQPRKLLGIVGSGEYRIRATYREEASIEAEAEAPADLEVAEEWEEAEAAVETEAAEAVVPSPLVTEQPEDSGQAIAARAQKVTTDIAEMIGVDVEVRIESVSEEEVRIELDGDDTLDLLIGQHGNTLDALQLIVAIAANKGIEDGCRVILDTSGGYRERQREHLQCQAHQAAEEAQATGHKVVMSDLKNYERRIVHMALADEPDVETYSEGEGRHRSLVISPVSNESSDW